MSRKQTHRDRTGLDLVFLDLLDERVPRIILQIQIHVSARRPSPRGNEERVPIDMLVAEDPQQTLRGVFSLGELHAHLGDLCKGLVGQNVGFDIPARIQKSIAVADASQSLVGMLSPRTDDVDSTAVVEGRPSQRVHDPSYGPFRSGILGNPQTIQKCCARTNQDQARILLVRRRRLSVLLDEIVLRQLGRVQGALEIDVDGLQIGLFRLLVVA